MSEGRNEIIDFLRGLAVLDMMLVHYSQYINIIPCMNVSKIINYSDFAIEGFIILFGYMIGNHYYARYIYDKKAVIKQLAQRVIQIIKIQYLLIITISMPLAVIMGGEFARGEPAWLYLTKSILFLNQVRIIHILPTFIFLLTLSIPILHYLKMGCDKLVIMMSIILFVIGNINPYLFTIGEKTIFPIILWQIYLTIGVILGKKTKENNNRKLDNICHHLIFAAVILIIMSFIYHGHHLFPSMSGLKNEYHIEISKFPLNYFGFIYHGSIFYTIYCSTIISWKYIKRLNILCTAVTVIGRHSMLAFVIHVYFAYTILLLEYLLYNAEVLQVVFIIINFIITFIGIRHLEARKMRYSF